jgi:hypothetical protein
MKGLDYENIKPKPIKKYKNKIRYSEINYYAFGKFILQRKLLNDENILLIKYPVSLAPVPKIRRTKISDDFKAIINDLLDTQKINIQLQKELNDKEQNLFELLINLSGLKDVLNYNRVYKDVKYYMDKFEVLRGSIIAGNDNDEIKKELIDVIDLLSNKSIGKISITDATLLKNELK